MKDLEYIKALTDIDESFVQEAMSSNKIKVTSKLSKKLIVAVAAVLALLTLLACVDNGITLVDSVEDDIFTDDGTLEPAEVRLKEICEEYGMPTDMGIDDGYADCTGYYYQDMQIGDYYYEFGYVSTGHKIFAFYLTNDNESEIKIETFQMLCNETEDEFKTETEYKKNCGTTVIMRDVEEGWKLFGSGSYFSGEAINENLPFAENMWYGKCKGGSGYSHLNDKAVEYADIVYKEFNSDSHRNEFVNR